MRKNLFIKSMLCLLLGLVCNVVWAQDATTPEAFLTIRDLDYGVNYPYALSEEQETAVFNKEILTIAMDVTMGESTSNNEAFICASDVSVTSDNTTYDNNSTFVAVGTQGGCIRLFASARSGGYYSGSSQLVAARNHKVVIVINSNNSTRTVYVDGVANTANHFQDFYHFRENENAHIYIGGGKNSAGNKYTFSGSVHSVQFFEGALTVEQITGIEYPETAGKAILAKAVTTNANMNIYGMQRLLGLVQNAGVGLDGDGQISCNFPANTSQESGNAYDNLLDGEYTTFFHSGYNNTTANTLGDALHYLQFSLNKPTKIFRFYYKKRSQNNNNRPTKITIQGSNDAQTWNDVSVISSGLPTDGALTDYFSEKITSPKAYQHYRFTINTTNSNASNGISFFSFSEFYLLPNSDRVNEVFDAVRAYRASATVANAETLNNVWNNGLPIVGEAQYIFANAKQSDGTYAAHYLYNNNGALATSNAPEGDKYAWIAVQPEGTTYYTFQNVSDPTKYISYGNNGNGIGVGNENQKVQLDIQASADYKVHSNSVGVKRIGDDSNGKWMVTAAAGNSFNRNSGKINNGSWTSDYLFVPANIYDGIRINCTEEFVNGEIYTFVTKRGWMGATASDKVISTARTSIEAADITPSNPNFQWTVYKSTKGHYYLYNIGKKQFMGVQTANNTEIDFVSQPAGKKLTFKESNSDEYPFMFSTDNAGVVNHSTNHGGGLVNWTGGWNNPNDEGSNHKISYVGTLAENELATIGELVERYDQQLYVTYEVEMSENNPNTHFGSVRATSTSGTLTTKLKKGEGVVILDYNGLEETTIDFTRAYRGFEFQGFKLGGQELGKSFEISEELKNSITKETPLVAKFDTTEAVTLFYDDDEFSYRIPAIDTTGTGRIIAVSDYRHNLDDIGRDKHGTGTKRIDLVIRTSDDNGKTWSEIKTIAAGDNSQTGSYLRAFGDAAIATVGENIVVMAAAGDVLYTSATAENPNRMARIFSDDNGETWTHQEMTTKMYLAEGIVPTGVAAFFGSGLLAVDADFNNTKTARIYGALLVRTYIEEAYNNYNNFVVYSDDLGLTWHILGGSQTPVASGDEPKVEILPNGQILLSARRNGGRVFNVFTYTDKESNSGTWSGTANGCNNGGNNGTNGEIFCVDAKKPDGTAVKLLLQSQPKGGSGQYDRKDVTIWYKEIDANTSYTATDIAANWTEGLQVSNQKSAYSTMTMQKDGKVAFFFEEAPCYADNHEKGYSMVYAPLTIETITKGNYFSPDTDLDADQTVNVVLTDEQGNEYRDQLTCALDGIAAAVTAKYPFITLGDNTAIEYEGESYTYTNSVTLPFKVSNEDNTVWHHIYYPSNTNNGYPIYLSASTADDTYVPKVRESEVYGNSTYNTADYADKISWAVYNTNNSFTFKFKNKLTGKYIQVTGVATGDAQNTQYAEEANATAFELVPDAASYNGDYALKATVESSTGYLCSTSASYGYATHYTGNGHQGAWVKFVEAPDFAALIDEVNSVLSLFGEGLGEYTPAEADKETLGIAKTAMENSSSVKLNDLNTYKALFTGATLNLPVEGQFFRIKAVEGWNNDAPYLGANNTTVNDKTTRAEFVAEADESTIFYYDGTQLVSYKSRHYLLNNNNFLGYNDVQASGTSIGFRAAAKGTVGAYNISFNNNRYLYTNKDNYTDAAGSTDNQDGYCFNLEEVTSLPVTISSVAYGTLYAPVALAIPEHVKAYTGVIDGDYLVLTKITTGIIPAETGVVLYRDEESYDTTPEGATTHDFSIVANPESSVTSSFSGSVATIARTSVDGEAYTLQTDTESAIDVAFKPSADDITGGKAYLVLPTQQAARALRIRFAGEEEGGTTSIDEGQLTIDNGQLTIYDLQGRRVLNPTKGMYIVNGKKIVIK